MSTLPRTALIQGVQREEDAGPKTARKWAYITLFEIIHLYKIFDKLGSLDQNPTLEKKTRGRPVPGSGAQLL